MVRVLRALGGLSAGQEMVVLMDREPLILYRELERRGLEWEFDGSRGILTIRRAEDTG